MLNEMRFGRMSAASIKAFKDLSRPARYDDSIAPTELFPRREDVDRSNDSRMSNLNTEGWTYSAMDGGTVTDPAQRAKLLSNFLAPDRIMVKEDAQVMLIKNVDETLVNGSMGKVMGFTHAGYFATDNKGEWDPKAIVSGMLNGDDDGESSISRTKQLLAEKISQGQPMPVVRWQVPGGWRDTLVEPDTFKCELPNGEIQASRTQVSLETRERVSSDQYRSLSSLLGQCQSTSRRDRVRAPPLCHPR